MKPIRIANFMDGHLTDLYKKGNLANVPNLYNPKKYADKVVHFTPCPDDLAFSRDFAEWNIEIFSYLNKEVNNRLIMLFVSLYKIYKKMRSERINIVRGRLPYAGSLMGCIAGKCLRVPCVVSLGGNNRIGQERNNSFYYGSKTLSYTIEKLVFLLTDIIIVPNLYTKNYVAQIIGRKKAEKKVRVIPWVVERKSNDSGEHINVVKLFGINPTVPMVLIVGFINKYKYSDIMFEVAEKTVLSNPHIQFVFCGDGPLRNEGQSHLKKYDNVFFIGWQPNNIVRTLIRGASVILVPMSGFVVLEAAATGKPVIASNVEWHGEIVRDGVSGFLVQPTSVEEWIKKLNIMLNNHDLSKRLGSNLREIFNLNYDPDVIIKKEITLYNSLLNGEL